MKYQRIKPLPTKEMRPLTPEQIREYRERVRKYGEIPEEPLPPGASLRNQSLMGEVYKSIFRCPENPGGLEFI